MQGIAIILLIAVFFWLVWPYIARWLRKKAAQKTEDFIRRATGMPPRPGSSEYRRQHHERRRQEEQTSRRNSRDRRNGHGYSEPLIPKEYAEDVEYTETKDFSVRTESSSLNENVSFKTEHQVSDAEWVEIKTDK